MMEGQSKTCAICGRAFAWRAKWKGCWEAVRYCSQRCRSDRLGEVDAALEAAILSLLSQRARHATICPSEAARQVRPDEWRQWMERARMAARRLVERGALVIVQAGRPVDPSTAKGVIRLRRA